MSVHVLVSSDLAVPAAYDGLQATLRAFDDRLRLRRSVDHEGCYVLERLTVRTKPIHVETQQDSLGNEVLSDTKIASRDGYLLVSHVDPVYLDRPDDILAELRRADLHATRADVWLDDLLRERRDRRERARAFQRDEWQSYFREAYDILDRVGDTKSHAERMRLSNAGGVERFNVTDHRRIQPEDIGLTSAGENPAQESSDVDTVSIEGRCQDGQLHAQAAAG